MEVADIFLVPAVLLAIVCGSLTFQRLNDRRRNPLDDRPVSIVACGIFLSISHVLILPPVYAAVDFAMPARNATDLISKWSAYVAVALLGGHIGRTFGSETARNLAVGKPGAIALALAATLSYGCFALTSAPELSPLLAAYADQWSVKLYNWVTLLYVAYIVGPLVPLAFHDAVEHHLPLGRAASLTIAWGFSMSVFRAFFYPMELTSTDIVLYYQIVTWVSTLLVVVGLAMFAFIRNRQVVERTFSGSGLSID